MYIKHDYTVILNDRRHDDMTCKHFRHYWPFVRGIRTNRFLPQRASNVQFAIFFVIDLNKLLKNCRVAGDLRRLNSHVTLYCKMFPIRIVTLCDMNCTPIYFQIMITIDITFSQYHEICEISVKIIFLISHFKWLTRWIFGFFNKEFSVSWQLGLREYSYSD